MAYAPHDHRPLAGYAVLAADAAQLVYSEHS
jgi:hypothetical protein